MKSEAEGAAATQSGRVAEERFFVTAAGHRLAVQRLLPAGGALGEVPPGRPTLVFLHEGLGSIAQWKGFPAALAGALGWPALVYERWGFGGSAPLVLPRPDDYLEQEAGQALPEVLAACGVERPVLVGHSDGATIALLYAALFPQAPLATVSMAAHVLVEPVTLAGIREAAAAWAAGRLRQALEKYHGAQAEILFRGWAETWQQPHFAAWQMLERLPAIRCPVLALQGVDDQYGTPRQLDEIVAGSGGPVERCLLPACGHSPHLEAPAATATAIAGFLARCLPDA